ncbi:MAG: alpha/beta hydrolase [Chloroflexota bacterium]
MTKRIGFLSFVVFGGLLTWLLSYYQRWLVEQTTRVSADSHIVETARGIVEYDIRGESAVILHFHGGNVGHNGWFMLSHLIDAGYKILTPDRPGYLGTPLVDNGSPADQADLMASLLDSLGIVHVVVVGVSAGGPPALEFASRYPERTRGLVLLSAMTKQVKLTDDQLNSTLGRLVMTERFQNPAYFLIHQAMHHLTSLTLQDYVRTETTYTQEEGSRYIDMVMADPAQVRQVKALADAIVPGLPRFAGVMNDLHNQRTMTLSSLDSIQTPTLIVHSEYDGDVPYDNATHALDNIPSAELITVAQFGHMIWWGDPQVTADFQRRITAHVEMCFARADA